MGKYRAFRYLGHFFAGGFKETSSLFQLNFVDAVPLFKVLDLARTVGVAGADFILEGHKVFLVILFEKQQLLLVRLYFLLAQCVVLLVFGKLRLQLLELKG